MRIIQASKALWSDRSGVTAIEYGLIAAGVAVVIVVAVGSVGTQLGVVFNGITKSLGG